MSSSSLAKGMYGTLWPKVEKCHEYVDVLLAAQGKLQDTIEQLTSALQEAEKGEKWSLVEYADRLKAFPSRVQKLQEQLKRIEVRLLAMKALKKREVVQQHSEPVMESPLF